MMEKLMLTSNFKRALQALVTLLLLTLAAQSTAQNQQEDKHIHSQLLSLFQRAAEPSAEIDWIYNYVDLASIARGIVSDHRTSMTEATQARFEKKFQSSIVGMFYKLSREAGDALNIDIKGINYVSNDRAIVQSRVTIGTGIFDVNHAMERQDALWRIKNLQVEGVNVGRTFKNQFNNMMIDNSMNVEAAIENWPASVEGFEK